MSQDSEKVVGSVIKIEKAGSNLNCRYLLTIEVPLPEELVGNIDSWESNIRLGKVQLVWGQR